MRLQGHSIFIFALARFDEQYESTSFTIARHLAKNNQVFYIDNPYTIKDYFQLKGTEAHARRKPYLNWSSDGLIETDTPNLHIIIPPLVPSIHFLPEGKLYRLALKFNEALVANRIEKVIKKFKIKDYIFINSYNFHIPGVGEKLNPGLTAYHCVDPLIRPFDVKHGIISEDELVRNSDVVICTSKQLYNEKKSVNPATYFVPNAADISHSQKALNPELAVASEIAVLPKPVIGYFGNIERRIDYDMMRQVIEANPDKSFAFVGPQEKEFIPDWFFNTKNLYLTGRMTYNKLPSVLKGFDVSLLPFKKDEVSRTIFPLKLFEYLGAGRSVVSTDFNIDLKDFTKDTVAYCSDAVTFSKAIEEALKSGNEHTAKRLAVAAENTWERRSAEFADLLYKHLINKTKTTPNKAWDHQITSI